ncbi:MAG: hydroxymethylbilane synthase, partial [Chloroflexota bacterium]|nr:hydroxymethylbilane synthase [Chloroflexota bacterium]
LIPIGAYGEVGDSGALALFAAVTSPDGAEAYRAEVNGPIEDPGVTGRAAYAALLEQGAGRLLGAEGAQ